MVKNLLFALFFIWGYPLFSQDYRYENKEVIEKLLKKKEKALTNKEKIEINLELGALYLYRAGSEKEDLDNATRLFEESLSLTNSKENPDLAIKILYFIAETNFEKNNLKKAVEEFHKVAQYYHEKGSLKEEADTWNRLGHRIFYDVPREWALHQETLSVADRGIKIYEALGLLKDKADLIKLIGDYYLNSGHLNLAEERLLEALKIYKSINYTNPSHAYELLSIVYKLQGNYSQSLKYNLRIVKEAEVSKDTSRLVILYSRLAQIYSDLSLTDKSVEFFKKAISTDQQISDGDHELLYRNTYAIVDELSKINKYSEALQIVKQILKNFPPKNIGHKMLMKGALGKAYHANNNIELAEKNFLGMIKGYEEEGADIINYPIDKSEAYYIIGKFYYEQKSYDKAKTNFEKSLSFPAGIISLLKIKETNLMLFKVDSAQGHYLNAIKYYQSYKNLNDSIFNEKNGKQIEELQISYDTEKKENDIKILQSQHEIQELKLNKMSVSKNIIVSFMILLFVITGLLWNSYNIKQKNNRILISQKGEIDQKNQTLQNLVVEKEWLLKEIHHRVKNNLQILMSLLNSQTDFIKNKVVLQAIKSSQHRLYAISLIHQKLYKTEDTSLIDINSYINDLINYLRDSYELKRIEFQLDVDSILLNESVSIPVGLILNETVTNAIKYACQENELCIIQIKMKEVANNRLLLSIKDNGPGIPESLNLEKKSSLGLSLLKGLTKQLGGTVEITNENGTHIKIIFENRQ